MSRWKDVNWNCGDGPVVQSVDHAVLATLMDIRDELKALNRVIGCHNFIRIPGVLDNIAANTKAKRKYTKRTTE